MLELKNITVSIDGEQIIKDFSIKVTAEKPVALMGKSGAGKTTILRAAKELIQLDSGDITAEGNMALMFQEPRLLPWKNAIENIKAVLPEKEHELAEKYLKQVGLLASSDKMPSELSGGMAQRVAFARFLAYAEATDAKILLLDEPFSSLDREIAEQMVKILKDFSSQKALLIVTHNELEAEMLDADIIYI